MKIVLITGNHLRHQYLASQILAVCSDVVWLTEKREAFLPEAPIGLSSHLKQLWQQHFKGREECELAYFSNPKTLSIKPSDAITIDQDDLTNGRVLRLIQDIKPNLILSYGCHKLPNEIIDLPGISKWNIHGGLSPWYRGVITHFWPTYHLEPQFTGMTCHETTDHIDGGAIILQTGVDLAMSDGIHDTACKAVKTFCQVFPDKLKQLNEVQAIKGISSATSGRIWISSMWHAGHLSLIYDHYDNRVTSFCIENNLISRNPKMVSVV